MAEEKITLVVRDAMVDCRRDQLWQRLVTNSPPLSFSEFVHLTTLVHSETLDEVGFIVLTINSKWEFQWSPWVTVSPYGSLWV